VAAQQIKGNIMKKYWLSLIGVFCFSAVSAGSNYGLCYNPLLFYGNSDVIQKAVDKVGDKEVMIRYEMRKKDGFLTIIPLKLGKEAILPDSAVACNLILDHADSLSIVRLTDLRLIPYVKRDSTHLSGIRDGLDGKVGFNGYTQNVIKCAEASPLNQKQAQKCMEDYKSRQ
jgi:hypothetical protein